MSATRPFPRNGERTPVTFHQVASIVLPWRWVLLGAMASVVAGAALDLVPPLVLRRLVDDNLKAGRVEGLLTLAAVYLGAIAAVQLLGFVTAYLTTLAAQGALRRLRVRLFAHLQELPISYYDHTPLGEVISRCTADMATIDTLFSSGVINVLAQSLRLVSAFVAMVALSPLLASVMIVIVPLLYWLTQLFRVRMREAERGVRRAVGVLNARLQEALTRVEVIRAFHWESRFVRRFRFTLHETLVMGDRSIGYGAVYSPTMNILSAVVIALLFWLSALPLLDAAEISIGTLTAFILLFQQFFAPLISIGNEWQVVQSALAGLERVFQVLGLPTDEGPSEERSAKSARKAAGTHGQPGKIHGAIVAVSHVSFGYRPGEEVLSDVSLELWPGQHLAVVGRTGAGKSSLFYLLGGLYRPWAGTIRVGGRDPCSLSRDERRHVLGAVPQVVQLFSGSVLENLTLGDRAIACAAVEQAALMSGADEFIRSLPQGYSTLISDLNRGAGVQMSAGQRQLLALTRALVWDPHVLILDEATAAVDSAMESAFRRALRAHLEERRGVVLTIAHRLSTALEAGYIVVLENGRVIEEGAPEELLSSGGRLATLWELENAGWEWRAPVQEAASS